MNFRRGLRPKIEIKGADSRMTVSNAALTVTSKDNDAFKIGCAGLKGQASSLSGADSSISFLPSKCEVFAAGAWEAEFSVENCCKGNSGYPDICFSTMKGTSAPPADRRSPFALIASDVPP